ncbi:hypothetical protein [Ferrovibrio sp.]|uniref:hypothetical protein n=1 Tax=Ferrovibrio sp. TaxID=1917215 RepID=UPI003D2A9C5E
MLWVQKNEGVNVLEQEAKHLLSRSAERLLISPERADALLIDYARDLDSLVRALMPLQIEAIEQAIVAGGGETVCLFAPRASYSTPLLNLADALQKSGVPHLLLSGDATAERLLANSNAYYCGRSYFRQIRPPAIFITPNLTELLPRSAISVYAIHDILDTPVGDEETFCRLGSCFDYFLVPSKPAMAMLQQIFARHPGWRMPVLIPSGYLRLDRNLALMKARGKQAKDRIVYAPTVLAAPDWRPFCTAYGMAEAIVRSLRDTFPDDTIVFRPHPHSVAAPEIQAAINALHGLPRVEIDLDPAEYIENYARAKLLVTDISGTAYTFAFTTLAPVLFVSPHEDAFQNFGQGEFYRANRDRIGGVAATLAEIGPLARKLVETSDARAADIAALREDAIYSIGDVADRIAAALPMIGKRGVAPDWVAPVTSGGETGFAHQAFGATPAQHSVTVRLHDYAIVESGGRFLARRGGWAGRLLEDASALAAAITLGEVLEAPSLGSLHSLIDAAFRRDVQEKRLARMSADLAQMRQALTQQAGKPAGAAAPAAASSPPATPRPGKTNGGPPWPQPALIERGYCGHNLVGFKDKVFAIRIGYGPIDLANPEELKRIDAAGYLKVFASEAVARSALAQIFNER